MAESSRRAGSVSGARKSRSGRPTQADFEALQGARLRFDLAELVMPDFGARNGAARPGFETPEKCVQEDHHRARDLACQPCPNARHLSALLRESDTDFAHPTLASRRSQRECRRAGANALLAKMEGYPDEQLCTFTIVKPQWSIAREDLLRFDPRELLNGVRRGMPQRSAMPAPSWLFGQIHGEYNSKTGLFQIHLHGVGTTDYVPPLREAVKACDRALIRQPLRIEKINYADRARQVSYLLQSFWPGRPTFVADGGFRRTRRKGRIPEPWGSLALLWLHRQTLSSIQLRLGLGNGGIGTCTRKSAENPSCSL